jgi:cell division transport system permease protein
MTLYPLKVAIDAIWREKWINLLCTFTIGTALFLISMALLFVHNVNIAVGKMPERFSITVFLKDGVSDEQTRNIVKTIKQNSAVKQAVYMSKDDALEELKTIIENPDYLLEGMDSNPLPASIEIKLRETSVTEDSVKALAAKMKDIKGIEDVQYGMQLLSVIQAVRKNSRAIGFLLVAALSACVLFVCYSTVKILLYRKKVEMDTLKLLGATRGFIKAPFIIEGAILGLFGGAVSVICMLVLYYLVYYRMVEYIPLLKTIERPVDLLLYTPSAGLLIGMFGAYIAVGRVKF